MADEVRPEFIHNPHTFILHEERPFLMVECSAYRFQKLHMSFISDSACTAPCVLAFSRSEADEDGQLKKHRPDNADIDSIT